MSKKMMSFRFEENIVDYLQCAVKHSGLSMTELVEGLIEVSMGSGGSCWEYGCVLTSSDELVIVRKPYYMLQTDLIQCGVGIIAAIPNELIPVEKCIEIAKAQIRHPEDILYSGDDIHSITIDSKSLSRFLADTFNVDVKAAILG